MDRKANPAAPIPAESRRRGESRIHPLVYRIILDLAAVLIVGIYGFSGGSQQYNGLVLTAAALFVLATVGISLVMRRIGRQRQVGDERADRFRAWLNREVEVWQGHLKGSDAVAAILLPIIAVSVGMVVFAIELNVVAH
jgi:uncharacterized membrane protein